MTDGRRHIRFRGQRDSGAIGDLADGCAGAAVVLPHAERSKQIVELFRLAKGIAAELGWELQEAATGGGSDGNFTAALGLPTLDGMGAVGEGAHANNESVVIAELPRRTALLGALIGRV